MRKTSKVIRVSKVFMDKLKANISYNSNNKKDVDSNSGFQEILEKEIQKIKK